MELDVEAIGEAIVDDAVGARTNADETDGAEPDVMDEIDIVLCTAVEPIGGPIDGDVIEVLDPALDADPAPDVPWSAFRKACVEAGAATVAG
jgi:hypothetical protein